MNVQAQAIFFDLDGTVVDTAQDLADSAVDAIRRLDLPSRSAAAIRNHASHGGRGLLRAARPDWQSDEQFDQAFQLFLQIYETKILDSSALYPGFAELLQRLQTQNIPWGLVTNKSQKFTKILIDHLDLKPNCWLSGDMVPRPKPHPEGLVKVAQQMGVPPSNCIYVGDDGRDVAAGKAAQMLTVAALYGYSHQLGDKELLTADFQVGSVAELSQLLELKLSGFFENTVL